MGFTFAYSTFACRFWEIIIEKFDLIYNEKITNKIYYTYMYIKNEYCVSEMYLMTFQFGNLLSK